MSYPILDCIDIHAHGFPERYLRAIAARYPEKVRLAERAGESLVAYWTGAPLPAWDPELRLREMASDGVAIEILSVPTIYAWLDQETRRFCEELNDFQAMMARERPDKFRSFLHLPVHEPDAAIRELGRWRNRHEVAGVVFGSNMGGIYPGDARLLPIWKVIEALDLPVFIHPVTPGSCFGPVVPPIVLFPCDTTLAAVSIIYGGIFDKFPGIKIILSHYGGALPFLAARLDMAVDIPGFPAAHGQDLPNLPSRYVHRFYFDTAQGFHRPAFDCARSVVGIEHILYGSDHFFIGSNWRSRLNGFLRDLKLEPNQLSAIVRGNAQRTFPCF